MLGGAHFSTFDEREYTVHGDCSYVLAKVTEASGLGHGSSRLGLGPGQPWGP